MRLRHHRCDYTPPMATSGPIHHLHPLDVFHTAHTLFCSTTNEKISLINIKYAICDDQKQLPIYGVHLYYIISYKIISLSNMIYPSSQKRFLSLDISVLWYSSQNSLSLPLFRWCWSGRWCPRLLGYYWWYSDSLYSCTKAHCTLPEHTHKPLNNISDNVGKTDIKKDSRGWRTVWKE